MAAKWVCMAFLYIAAWQDYKKGSVSLLLLLFSVAVSVVLTILDLVTNAAITPLILERSVGVFGVAALMGGLALCKKMGGADVILFAQITLLYGIIPFTIILALASVTGVAVTVAQAFVSAEKESRKAFWKREIRFIPFIALSTQAVLVFEWLAC